MVRVIKKEDISTKKEMIVRIVAVLLTLLFVAFILLMLGYNPFKVYYKLIEGSIFSAYRFKETINKAIPLTILSLGVAVAFKMKFWNIGAEGQMCMGAFGATWTAFTFGWLPAPVLLLLMLLVSMMCGGLWAFIPAILKSKFSTSETLVTLMLNYIALKWISYLQYGPWKDPLALGFPKIATFPENAILPSVLGVHIGWIIALIMTLTIHYLLNYSKLGYEIAVLGESEATARYAGMNIFKIIIVAVFISGGLCGSAGMMQASAIEHTLTEQLSGGLGFTAVITTWLAKLSAPMIVFASFLFSMMLQGGTYLQSSMKIPSSVAEVLQAMLIFFVLGSEFFIRYKLVFIKSEKEGK